MLGILAKSESTTRSSWNTIKNSGVIAMPSVIDWLENVDTGSD